MQCAHLVLWYYYRANKLYLNCFTCSFTCSPSTIVYTLSTAPPTTDTHLCTTTTSSTCASSCVLANTINYYNVQLCCVVYSVPTNGSSSPHLYSTLNTISVFACAFVWFYELLSVGDILTMLECQTLTAAALQNLARNSECRIFKWILH